MLMQKPEWGSIPTPVVEHGSPGNKRNRWMTCATGGSCDHDYLIYKAFRQKSEVFDSNSGFGIQYFGIVR